MTEAALTIRPLLYVIPHHITISLHVTNSSKNRSGQISNVHIPGGECNNTNLILSNLSQ